VEAIIVHFKIKEWTATLAAFAEAVRSPAFLANRFSGLNSSPIAAHW
jgi:hypothetical protein